MGVRLALTVAVLALGAALGVAWWTGGERGEVAGLERAASRASSVHARDGERADALARPDVAPRTAGAADDARTPAAIAFPALPPLPDGGGTLRGVLLDELGARVGPALVTCRAGEDRVEAEVRADGTFVFEGLPAGRYWLHVDARSLEGRFLPPWRQERRAAKDAPPGFGGTFVDLEEGGEASVELFVFRPATAIVRVVDERGEPVPNAYVRLASTAGVVDAGVSATEGEVVVERLYPGDYTACVLRVDHVAVGARAPAPLAFTLAAGERLPLPDLVLGSARPSLRGRVRDEKGGGVPGVQVECRELDAPPGRPLWRAVTGDDGVYELAGVAPARVVVTFDVGRQRRVGDTRIRGAFAATLAPIEVDLRSAFGVVELEDRRLLRSDPFTVNGTIEVDPAWAAREGFEERKVRIVATPSRGFVRPVADPDPRVVSSATYDPDRGTFVWSCPTPSEPMELHVTLIGASGEGVTRTLTVDPRPGGQERRIVLFP